MNTPIQHVQLGRIDCYFATIADAETDVRLQIGKISAIGCKQLLQLLGGACDDNLNRGEAEGLAQAGEIAGTPKGLKLAVAQLNRGTSFVTNNPPEEAQFKGGAVTGIDQQVVDVGGCVIEVDNGLGHTTGLGARRAGWLGTQIGVKGDHLGRGKGGKEGGRCAAAAGGQRSDQGEVVGCRARSQSCHHSLEV